jgi:hypothetical protein
MPARRETRVGNGEIERRVRCLTRLIPGWQIATGYQVKAGRCRALAVRHMRNYSRISQAVTEPRGPGYGGGRD